MAIEWPSTAMISYQPPHRRQKESVEIIDMSEPNGPGAPKGENFGRYDRREDAL